MIDNIITKNSFKRLIKWGKFPKTADVKAKKSRLSTTQLIEAIGLSVHRHS